MADGTAVGRLARHAARAARDHAPLGGLAADGAAWALAVPLASALRRDFAFDDRAFGEAVVTGLFAAEVHVGTAVALIVGRGRARYASFHEAATAAAVTVVTSAVVFTMNLLVLGAPVRPGTPLLAGSVALTLMLVPRALKRAVGTAGAGTASSPSVPVVVFGAGERAERLIESMIDEDGAGFRPVAVLDDDRGTRGLRLGGIPVVGGRERLAAVAAETGARVLIVAVRRPSAELLGGVMACAAGAGVEVRVLPPIGEVVGNVTVAEARPVTDADLLGRHQSDTGLGPAAAYLTGRRVLVTGAGGSIGSELCRQVARFRPARLVLVDRDESALHAVQLSIDGRALLETDDLVVADIRDRDRVEEVFATYRPEVVFHAAALKHLPLLERHPAEGVKTNILGTLHVLDAAVAHGAERFVNISTDKAADAVSVLGHTKRITERLTAGAAADSGAAYLSVRFGNVLGSRGSVLTTFRAQIEAGGPVTVTDPTVTRFLMTVEEAAQLVIQAGAIGSGGEVLVLEMGEPVRIADVARRLIEASGRPVDVVFTGLRPGEKRHEVLFAADEEARPSSHPLIHRVEVPPLRRADVFADGATVGDVASRLSRIASQRRPAVTGVSARPGHRP